MKALSIRLQSARDSLSDGRFSVWCAKAYIRAFPSVRYKMYGILSRLIDADIDARTALEFIYELVSKGGTKPGEFDAVAVSHWIAEYREHGRLSDALVGWVPQTEILLIEAGERSGRFQHALGIMLKLNSKLSSIRKEMIGNLVYPVAVALLLLGIMRFLSTEFLPQIIAIKGENGVWTGSAATVIGLLTWIRTGLVPALIGVVLVVGTIVATMPYFRGPIRSIFDRIPPWSLHRFTSGIGFLTALLVLMESGRGLLESLTLVRPNSSPYLNDKLVVIEDAIREGKTFGEALAEQDDAFPDDELVKEIQVYSKIGRLDDGLLNVVEEWMVTATDGALSQISILKNVMFVAIAATIALLFSGVYDIIMQLQQGLQQ